VTSFIQVKRLGKNSKAKKITILRKRLNGIVPQTFPILLDDNKLRDRLYFQMNKEGYGVVSLYHTLVDAIDESFVVEHDISSKILNLPVHQDVVKKDLKHMVDKLLSIISHFDVGKRNKNSKKYLS